MDTVVWIMVGIVMIALFATTPRWVPALLWRYGGPGRAQGLRVEFTPARVDEDRVIDRTWAVPIVMRNDGHRPRRIPLMAARAVFWSNRRTRLRRRQTEYVGHLIHEFDYEVLQQNGITADRVLNPGDEVVFTAYVTLPGDQHPERLQIAVWDGQRESKSLRAALPESVAV